MTRVWGKAPVPGGPSSLDQASSSDDAREWECPRLGSDPGVEEALGSGESTALGVSLWYRHRPPTRSESPEEYVLAKPSNWTSLVFRAESSR